jgi:asparagine synthase (glutamine-hydrolysing)
MDEIREQFDQLMTQAVARQITGSDVVSLSGGIDSPTVAVYAAPLSLERYGHPIGALSEVYPDYPAVDESRFIKVVTEQLGIQSHTFVPESRPLDDILEWVRLCDGPVPVHPPSESAEFYRLARKLGYQTVLGGDLAEFVMDRKYGMLSHLLIHGRLPGLWKHIRDEQSYGHTWLGIFRQLASTFAPRALMVARERRRRPDPLFPDWMDIRILNQINTRWTHSPRERWLKEQVAFFVGPGIGLEADEIIGAVCGVRPRRPWIDVDLCEFFLSLPAGVKFPAHRSKTLVRSLLRGKVPDEILNRTDKTYFNERLLARIDYPALRHWLINPKYRLRGVNYERLADRLEREDLNNIGHYKWAIDLAKSHAFLSQW